MTKQKWENWPRVTICLKYNCSSTFVNEKLIEVRRIYVQAENILVVMSFKRLIERVEKLCHWFIYTKRTATSKWERSNNYEAHWMSLRAATHKYTSPYYLRRYILHVLSLNVGYATWNCDDTLLREILISGLAIINFQLSESINEVWIILIIHYVVWGQRCNWPISL